ncbi:MAG: hypothetical protein DRQ49_16710 [Gammaproteobacteria bacterium]|nr:MAG: hypothetical protein DRQ49_16710 [Gammaproteobacteria bacterium]RKZ43715.1 MAG: hypothetical protein DRQ41_04590 [Gammaproteobacteria bacterium]RKZ73582.1 MAG: hypothetical protein DRQ57_13895 [Gammaproteobacteria bacterium]
MSIHNKFIIIISSFVIFMVATVIISLYMINGKTADAAIIGIAARQQMLIVQIENETRAMIALLESESSTNEQRQKLKKMVIFFDKSLSALKNGGMAENSSRANIKLSASTGQIETQLGKVQSLWKPALEALNIILDPQVDIISDKFYDAINALNDSWVPILVESVKAVIFFEQASDKKVAQLKLFLFVVLLLTFMVALFSLFFGKKHIVNPIKMMLKATSGFHSGSDDMTYRLPDFGQDEIGQIADAINGMRDNIHTAYESLRKSRDKALRINHALDNVTTSVLIANDNYQIIYVNHAASQLLKKSDAKLRQALPDFESNCLLDTSIDIFDSHPRELLDKLTTTHHTHIAIDNLYIDISINPVFSEKGQRLGWVTEFRDRSAEIATEQEVNAVMYAASQGDFQQHINLSSKTGFFKTFSEMINQLLDLNLQMIKELKRVFAAMAKGDLTQSMTLNYAGLLEQLKMEVNSTVTQLTVVMGAIKETADTVNYAAVEISQGSFSLSQRTEEQAAVLEETTVSMEEMTDTVQKNAKHTNEAAQLAVDAEKSATNGRKVVGNVVGAMTEIKKSSQQIADIISIIDEIAFQTNLLALNAAVEAARAGEQGRGFAVVATEVRHLAQRSATAAKEIKELIQDSVNKVEEGTRLANQSDTRLEKIVTVVKKVSDIMAEIAAASHEQSTGIQQVNKALMQMDQVTQQNAILVQELANASQSMKEDAQNLKEHVAFFKTAKTIPTVSSKVMLKKHDETKKWLPLPNPNPNVFSFSQQDDDEWKDF